MSHRYARVAARAGHRCEYCHAPEAIFNFPFEIEHIVPLSLGGQSEEGNLALACRSCNVHKAARTDGLDPKSGEAVRLYHPRIDEWQSHFVVMPETTEIVGRTPIGRVTVTLLQLNRESQRVARHQWMRLGLFP